MYGARTADETVDILVVGGGVFGLWAATRAIEAGFSVLLIEREWIGAGASGGQLGALTAHTPDRWSPKKAFQLASLAALPEEIAQLEAETGLAVDYARTGRLMPIRSAAFAAQIPARTAGAQAHWAPVDAGFRYDVAAPASWPAGRADWLSPAAAPLGAIVDTLAARLAPRAYLAALAARARRRARLREGVGYLGWSRGAADLGDGARVAAGAVVIAAGYESFEMLAPAARPPMGSGVKGQSALLRPPRVRRPPPDAPLLYDDGVYVIAHADGLVAVGATSRADWTAPAAPDPSDDAFLEKARTLCPALEGAEIVEWWAGVRPKSRHRDPLIGRMPDPPGGAPLWAMTGGFKISFGVAHRAASALIDRIADRSDPTALPESFSPAARGES